MRIPPQNSSIHSGRTGTRTLVQDEPRQVLLTFLRFDQLEGLLDDGLVIRVLLEILRHELPHLTHDVGISLLLDLVLLPMQRPGNQILLVIVLEHSELFRAQIWRG